MTRMQILKKVIKPRTLFFLIILLSANAFAWFIYATQADTGMSAHIKAWSVLFEAGDSPIVDYVSVNTDSLYPGMEEYVYTLTAYNKSEIDAHLSYALLEAKILDDEYISIEGRQVNNETVLETDLSSDDLIIMLEEEYPFKIELSATSNYIDAETGQAKFVVTINWPYESGDDAMDTYWGNQASLFKELNPTSHTISLRIRVSITQISD